MANAIPTAQELIRERLQLSPGGSLPWREVMDLALYAPGSGYYRQGVRRIGRGGDFYTSVSVGPLYGVLLAESCLQVWQALGEPEEFAIIEQGANDGTLAEDILRSLEESHPALAAAARYVIIEPDETHRQVQHSRLGDKIVHLPGWDQFANLPAYGLLICNELLDAFPVHRVQFAGDEWREVVVRLDVGGGFRFDTGEISDPRLRQELSRLGGKPSEGTFHEVNLAMLDWVREVAAAPFQGAIFLADYGYATDPDDVSVQTHDTLRRYHQHRMDGKVLENLGACDLTAHVDFTLLAQTAVSDGLAVVEFIEQGRFLTRLASAIMQRPGFQPGAAWMRQFQSLTHPGHLGHQFQVLLLAKGLAATSLNDPLNIEAALRRLAITPPQS